MFKSVQPQVWVFDIEWAPDPRAGRVLYGLPADLPDADVMAEMWKRGGATEEDPFPFLKTALCRVLSIAAVTRRAGRDGAPPDLKLLWLPRDPADPALADEKSIIGKFLQGIGKTRPQLVGFNSQSADLKVLIQRGVILGLEAPEFCRRPDKPWEGADYFARGSEWNVDLMEILGGWGKSAVSLHEMASLSGIPGKFQTAGEQVAHLWLAGKWTEIIRYNCFDALSTYLLWLRMAHFAGLLTREQYDEEQETLRQLIMEMSEQPEGDWITAYFDEWERLQQATGQV